MKQVSFYIHTKCSLYYFNFGQNSYVYQIQLVSLGHFKSPTKKTLTFFIQIDYQLPFFLLTRFYRHFWHNDSFLWKLQWYSTNPWSSQDWKQSQDNCCNKWRKFWDFPWNFISVSEKFSFHYLFLWKQYQRLLKFKR